MQNRTRYTRLGGVLSGLLLAMLAAVSVAAYSGEVAATVQVNAPGGPQTCVAALNVSAVVEDINGKPISGQPVTFSFVSGNVSGDSFVDATVTTNSSGVATTQVKLNPIPHTVRVKAVADAALGTVSLTCSGAGLPRTDTVPASNLPAMALAALAVLIGSGTILRRFAADRR